MNRTRALIVSLAVGLAAVAGVSAVSRTVGLGDQAQAKTDVLVAKRTTQLDRYEATLRKALVQKPPALPPVPASAAPSAPTQSAVGAAAQSAAPTRVVYHRPPPIVVTSHRAGGEDEHEDEHEVEIRGGEDDD